MQPAGSNFNGNNSLLYFVTASLLHLCRQRVLVVGGGGAVGFAAIQLGVAAGCHVSTTCGSESIARVVAAGAEQAVDYTSEVMIISSNNSFQRGRRKMLLLLAEADTFFNSQDVESALKGNFDAVLDTIGVAETERVGTNLLKRGGYYMTLQVGNYCVQLLSRTSS